MIFSSFDIYIVAMLCLKQKSLPVFQLMTMEKHEDLGQFVKKTLAVAPLLKILGVKGYIFNTIFLLKAQSLIKELRDMGFLVWVYGESANSGEGITKMIGMGVSGFCTDHVAHLDEIVARYKI
jgi:glycerophosphoryl diester phosphodiesterase